MLFKDHELFVFDWDGTLSTSTMLVRATRLLKHRYNIGYIRSHSDKFRIDTIDKLDEEEQISKLYNVAYLFYSLFAHIKLKKNSLEILKKLKKEGKTVAIFSDSNKYRLLLEVKRLGVLDYIDFILSADLIKRFKPNPTGLIATMDRFKVRKSKCIYIGDMAVDVYTANFAGVDVAVVGDGVDPYQLLKELKPTYAFRDSGALLAAL